MISVEALNDRLIDLAFSEDIGDGDHTTLCCIPADEIGKSKLMQTYTSTSSEIQQQEHVAKKALWQELPLQRKFLLALMIR